ncbi:MAG: nuclear transport factor 2 family protein [Acidobacteriota bacterium]
MSETTVQEILNLEEQLRQAEMRVDSAALDAFFADEIMVTAPMGIVVDKSAVMSEVKRATKVTIERYDKKDINVRAFDDTAVTSYRVKARARSDEGQVDREFQMSNVWLKRQGRWQVVARHTAAIEQPKVEQRTA